MALQLIRNYILNNCIKNNLLKYRNIMTTSFNMEKIEDELEKNPYYLKYADKIEALKKSNPDEFMAKLKEVDDKKNPNKDKKNVKRSLSPTRLIKPKNLNDIMKLELINDKKSDEVKQIWYEFHKDKDCVANVISNDIYNLMLKRSIDYPTFLHPVPRDKGYEFYMSFFENNIAHFTPLRKYQIMKDNSPECLEICYFNELSNDKNIVLIRGTYDKDELSNLEANCLASSFQLYYGGDDDKRMRLLDLFNNCPDEFQHMDLIAEFEAFGKPKPM